jgi:hypothetical protein
MDLNPQGKSNQKSSLLDEKNLVGNTLNTFTYSRFDFKGILQHSEKHSFGD